MDCLSEAQGWAYPPASSRRMAARLLGGAELVQLQDAEGAVLSQGQPQRETRVSGAPSRVVLPDGWVFETDDHPGLEVMLGAARGDWLVGLERFHPRLVVVILGCLFGVWLIWRFGLDLLVSAAIALTPAAFVALIDSSNLAAMDRLLAEPTQLSQPRQAELSQIFEDLRAVAPAPPVGDYTLYFRDIPRLGPNAFALPGGAIVVTDDFVEEFGDRDTLAAVFGHEMAHVSEQHALQQVYRALSIYVLVALIAGDVGPVLEDALLEGGVLLSLSHSREHESEADRIGVQTAHAAGYDPAALIGFFEALERDYGSAVPSWRSSHPDHADRAAQIRQHLRALP